MKSINIVRQQFMESPRRDLVLGRGTVGLLDEKPAVFESNAGMVYRLSHVCFLLNPSQFISLHTTDSVDRA